MAAPRLKPDFTGHAGHHSPGATRAAALAPSPLPLETVIARATFLNLLAAVTVLALYPRLQLPEPSAFQGSFDKVAHALAFFALALLGAGAWQRRRPLIGGLVFYAVIFELSQWFSAGREVNINDTLASLVGLAIGFGLVVASRRVRAGARAAGRAKNRPPAATG